MMKKLILIALIPFFYACNQASEERGKTSNVAKKETSETKRKQYPENFKKVLDAHGSIAHWDSFKTLSFKIPKPNGAEMHTIDLHKRKAKVTVNDIEIGFDGEQAWILDTANAYQGNPAFYHNLMFYFYAMPFVLADDGIIYGETEALEVAGKRFPGIKISFRNDIGSSPKDEYFLYYHPETYEMKWLGYTATFGADERSDKISYIAYHDWVTVKDILLPKSISWHNAENGEIKEKKNTVTFENTSLDKASKSTDFYTKPDKAKIAGQ